MAAPPSINSIIRRDANNLQVLCNDGSGLFETSWEKNRLMTIMFELNINDSGLFWKVSRWLIIRTCLYFTYDSGKADLHVWFAIKLWYNFIICNQNSWVVYNLFEIRVYSLSVIENLFRVVQSTGFEVRTTRLVYKATCVLFGDIYLTLFLKSYIIHLIIRYFVKVHFNKLFNLSLHVASS